MKVQFLSPAWQLGTLLAAWMLLLSSARIQSGTAPPAAAVESAVPADAAPAVPIAENAARVSGTPAGVLLDRRLLRATAKGLRHSGDLFRANRCLEKQILELHAKQDQDVDAILSAEQLAEIEKLRAAAAAKRRSQPATQETVSGGQQ